MPGSWGCSGFGPFGMDGPGTRSSGGAEGIGKVGVGAVRLGVGWEGGSGVGAGWAGRTTGPPFLPSCCFFFERFDAVVARSSEAAGALERFARGAPTPRMVSSGSTRDPVGREVDRSGHGRSTEGVGCIVRVEREWSCARTEHPEPEVDRRDRRRCEEGEVRARQELRPDG